MKAVEGTVMFRWLLNTMIQSQEIQFDNVLTETGELKALTLREMITLNLVPQSHVQALRRLFGQQMRVDMVEDNDQEDDAPTHPDDFFGDSMTNPLRGMHPPHLLMGVVEASWIPAGAGRPEYSKAELTFGKHATMAALYGCTPLELIAMGLPEDAESAAFSFRNRELRRAWGSRQNHANGLWARAFMGSHTGLHQSVSLVNLPALSKPAGARPVILSLGFESGVAARANEFVWFSSRSDLHNPDCPPKEPRNNWTTLRLRAALQTVLFVHTLSAPVPLGTNLRGPGLVGLHAEWYRLFRQSGRLPLPNLRISSITRVEKVKQYWVGREKFTSSEVANDARSHCLVICPVLDHCLNSSHWAQQPPQKLIFRPDLLFGRPADGKLLRNIPDGTYRSYLHPALILAFLLVTVEVFYDDYVQRADRYLLDPSVTGFRVLVVPFALCRFHKPHIVHRYHAWGDLCEIWSSEFLSVDWDSPHQVASHLIPLNRLAGKFSPGYMDAEDYPAHCIGVSRKAGMMVLRHPLH
jgi:hypothetical protein